jgi:hypothetical protein
MKDVIKALKALGVIAAGIAALAASQALAAGLGTTSQSLGSGQQTVSACTQDAFRVSYATAYTPALGTGSGYAVTDVTLTDTATTPNLAACAGQTYRVTLLGASGAFLGEVTGVVPGGATSFSPAGGFTSPVDASAVTGVAVVMGG